MNPRSDSQPTESHSRRLPPAVIAAPVWSAARVALVTATPIAPERQG
jgi:hypothetical protein